MRPAHNRGLPRVDVVCECVCVCVVSRAIFSKAHTSLTQFLTSEDGHTTIAFLHSALRWRSTHVHRAIAVAVFPSPISSARIAPRPSYLAAAQNRRKERERSTGTGRRSRPETTRKERKATV